MVTLSDAALSRFLNAFKRTGRGLYDQKDAPPCLPKVKSTNQFEGVLNRPSATRTTELRGKITQAIESRDTKFDQELRRWADRNLSEAGDFSDARRRRVGGIVKQFEEAHRTDSESLHIKGSREHYFDLESLPDCLTQMHSLKHLTVSKMGIESLPALPQNLATLSIKMCQLNAVPVLPPQLITLQLDYNELTSLPCLPSFLRVLTAQGNELAALPSMPDTIRYIDVSNNQLEHIQECLSKSPQLRYLNVDFNRLGAEKFDFLRERKDELVLHSQFADEKTIRMPDDGIRRHLRQARAWVAEGSKEEQVDRRKAFLEIERVYAQFEFLLDLSHLNLSSLPPSLHAIGHISTIYMDGNRLTAEKHVYHQPVHTATGLGATCWSEETIEQIRGSLNWAGEREAKLDEALNAPRTGIEIINHWQSPGEATTPEVLKIWVDISNDDRAAMFLAFLNRLTETAEYRQPEALQGFKRRVDRLLTSMRKSEDLREHCFAKVVDVSSLSSQGITLMLDDMEVARIREDAEKSTYGLDDLHRIGQGLFRLEVVEAAAAKKIAQTQAEENLNLSEDADEVSIRLRRHAKLAERLGLPVARGLGSQIFAEEKDSDLLHIEEEIDEMEKNTEYVEFFVEWAPWRTAIQAQYPQDFVSINNIIQRRANYLSTTPARTSDAQWKEQIAAFEIKKERWLDATIDALTRNYLSPESDSDDSIR